MYKTYETKMLLNQTALILTILLQVCIEYIKQRYLLSGIVPIMTTLV